MKVTILGSGTSQGVPVIACQCPVCQSGDARDRRLRSSVLVEVDGKVLVVDSGPDFRQQMLAAKVWHLDAVLFTHGHKDHQAGLDDIRAYNYVQQQPMDIYAEERVQKGLRQEFPYIFSDHRYPGVPEVHLHTITQEPFFIGDTRIVPVRVMHMNLPVLGFRIGSFAYITDANWISDEEMTKLEGLDCLIINGLRHRQHISHYTLSQAVAVIDRCGARRGYITHVSHQMGLHAEVERELPAHIRLAYDGLELNVE
jgi:phosphoribosyl 1,2-cyclic phosphate phosphodiesterase